MSPSLTMAQRAGSRGVGLPERQPVADALDPVVSLRCADRLTRARAIGYATLMSKLVRLLLLTGPAA